MNHVYHVVTEPDGCPKALFTRNVFTGRNEVVAKVMFLLVSVILLTGGGWVPASVHVGIPPPRSRHPP